ncbi:MAG: ArnT family glycosyltransferase [Chitinophagales bacterium]
MAEKEIQKKLFRLILVTTGIRCCVAIFLELGNDEVYYWTYAQHLEWNYFDHPPMVGLLIRMTSLNLLLQSEFFIRLGSILCSAINTWLIFRMGCMIRNEKAGWYAALLFTSSIYCSIIAGTFILPDSPQLLFWILSVYLMLILISPNQPSRTKNLSMLALGVCIGLCIMSKVHGIFLWFGFGAYILFYQRQWLRSPYLYFAGLLTFIIISPIFIWNLNNHFITYSFHSNRVGFWAKKPDLDNFVQQFIGSVFYCNPVNFIIYVVALIALFRNNSGIQSGYQRLLLLLGLPLIILLWLISFFNETLPHWSGPAYISIILIAAIYLERRKESSRIPVSLIAALGLILIIVVLGIPAIKWLPRQVGNRQEEFLGKSDPSLDLNGWKKFSLSFDSLYQNDKRSGLMSSNPFILSDYWFPAAHLDYYLARPMNLNFFAVGGLNAIHHYGWLNKERPAPAKGSDAYFIYPSNYYGPPRQSLRNCFAIVDDSLVIRQFRSNIPIRNFIVYRMHDYQGGIARDGELEIPQ